MLVTVMFINRNAKVTGIRNNKSENRKPKAKKRELIRREIVIVTVFPINVQMFNVINNRFYYYVLAKMEIGMKVRTKKKKKGSSRAEEKVKGPLMPS